MDDIPCGKETRFIADCCWLLIVSSRIVDRLLSLHKIFSISDQQKFRTYDARSALVNTGE